MINHQRLEYATEGFLATMRLEFAKTFPGAPNPVKRLIDYSGSDRGALLKAVGTAIAMTEVRNDQAFEAWRVTRPPQ